jgi:hypothetical protein
MRRTDGGHGPLNFPSLHALGFAPLPSPRHDTETRRKENRSVDVPERETGHWETAWIDLGGEG